VDLLVDDPLRGVIHSRRARKAIYHVIKRACELNNGYFPVYITKIGLSGSALRIDKPKDVDIVVYIDLRESILNEWYSFKEKLRETFEYVWNMICDLSLKGERATIEKILERGYNNLLQLGFKNEWLKNWMIWVKITDYRWMLDRGLWMIGPRFDMGDLTRRYLKYNWKRPRLEIHFNPLDERIKVAPDRIPNVVIWDHYEGIVIPTEESLIRFYTEEYEELMNVTRKLINLESGLSYLYDVAIYYVKYEPKVVYDVLKNVIKKLRKFLIENIMDLKYLSRKSVNVYELKQYNTLMRKKLKTICLIGQIIEKIRNNEWKIMNRLDRGVTLNEAIVKTIYKSLLTLHFNKAEVENIIRGIS